MKKKIGILTFHNSFNYGALLQAYATQEFLTENGFDASFINYTNSYENKGNRLINIKKNLSLKQNIIQNIKNIMFGGYYYTNKSFIAFIKSLHKTELINKNFDYNVFDVIISGSDQIWNPVIYGDDMDTMYLLNFNYNGKRISYASSMGSYIIDEKNKDIFKNNLLKYSHISVREKHALEQIKKIGIDNVQIVCDPTMLMGRAFWNNVVNKNPLNINNKKYILIYLMSKYEKYENQIKLIKEYFGYDVVFITFSNLKRKYVDKYALGYTPFEFLTLIKNAELVLTNSFHGTVFSLIFNKNFYNLENSSNSKRTENLLNIFKITDRIIKSNDNVKDIISKAEAIDYERINIELDNYSNGSRKWLLNAISDESGVKNANTK